jgi:hypothetical protein
MRITVKIHEASVKSSGYSGLMHCKIKGKGINLKIKTLFR